VRTTSIPRPLPQVFGSCCLRYTAVVSAKPTHLDWRISPQLTAVNLLDPGCLALCTLLSRVPFPSNQTVVVQGALTGSQTCTGFVCGCVADARRCATHRSGFLHAINALRCKESDLWRCYPPQVGTGCTADIFRGSVYEPTCHQERTLLPTSARLSLQGS
jgi:hypothetical protein